MTRLFATGKILYELFACEGTSLLLEDGTLKQDTIVDNRYEDVKNGNHQPRKKSYQSQQTSSNCVARLLSNTCPLEQPPWMWQRWISWGWCLYSFLELKQDLGLMLADPSRFLEDIQVKQRPTYIGDMRQTLWTGSRNSNTWPAISTTHQHKHIQRRDYLRRGGDREITSCHAHPKANKHGKWILLCGQVSAKQHACKAIINDWGTVQFIVWQVCWRCFSTSIEVSVRWIGKFSWQPSRPSCGGCTEPPETYAL